MEPEEEENKAEIYEDVKLEKVQAKVEPKSEPIDEIKTESEEATKQAQDDSNCSVKREMSTECSSHLAQLLTNSPAPTTSAGAVGINTNNNNMNLKPNGVVSEIGQQCVQKQTVGSTGEPFYCSACGSKIVDRFLLKSMDKFWHEDCLKCDCCQCRLAEDGCKLYYKEGMHLCKRDYLRLFGLTGLCAACHKSIPAFEMVMRARANVYHLECFGCQQCNHRFCVGDKFYLWDNKILCEYDYQERTLFAQMASNYNSIAQLKRQFPDDLDVEVQPVQTR